jgi:hypothetical protein
MIALPSPPAARLVPRGLRQHAHAGGLAATAWCVDVAVAVARGIMLVAPLLVLSGAVLALAVAVATPPSSGSRARHGAHRGLLAPAPPAAGLCTHAERAERDACWEALFERMRQPRSYPAAP